MKNSTENRSASKAGRSRYFASRLILILFGIFLLVVVEGVLRIMDIPAADQAITQTSIDPFHKQGSWMVTRDIYLQSMRGNRFKAEKPLGLTRIFCLGGSTTQGYPFPEEAAWPSRLDSRLNRLYGDKIEVVNLGAASYGSSRTLGLLRGVLKYDPDIIIVCCGDSEFVEDSYLTALRQVGEPASWWKDLRLARLLARLLPGQSLKPVTVPAEDLSAGKDLGGFLFSPVVHGTVYRPDEKRRSEVMDRFSRNLNDIVSIAREKGIKVVLCTLPSNLKSWPPDYSLSAPPGDPEQWRRLAVKADMLEGQGNSGQVLEVYKKMAQLRDGDPMIHYRYGKALFLAGKTDAARYHLIKARDMDPTPVRATSHVNEAIRRLAQNVEIPLADLEIAFNDASPGGLTGEELILDYAHPTEEGHALAERVVWRALAAGFAQWAEYPADIEQVISSELVKRYEPDMDSDLAFVWGQIYERKELWDRAEAMFRRSLTLNTRHQYAALSLARILIADGSYGEAIRLLEKVIIDVPQFLEPYLPLATAHYFSGNLVSAEKYFRKSIDLGEKSPAAIRGLITTYLDLGNAAGAMEVGRQGIKLFPDDCFILAGTGRALELQGNDQEAEQYYRDELRENTKCPLLWENLGLLYLDKGRLDDAVRTFQSGIKTAGSSHPLHHLNLGYIFLRQGNEKSAIEQFITYVRSVPDGVQNIPSTMQDHVKSMAFSQ